MGLFSSIISSIGNGISDVFGGGDSNDQQAKKKQNIPSAPAANSNLTAQKINLPTPLLKAAGPPKPLIPITVPTAANTANLTAQPAQPAQPSAGLFHDLTHNPVTNVVGGALKFIPQFSEDYNNTFANLGNKAAGGKGQTIQQNMGGDPLLNSTLKMSAATGTNKQLASDTGQIALTAAAPAADKFIANPITDKLLASGASKIGSRFIGNTAAGAPILGAFNAASAAGNGANANQTLTAALQGAATAPAFAVGGELIRPVIGAIKGARATTPSDVTTSVAPELSGGVVADEGAVTPPESGTKGPEEPTPTNGPTNEPGKPVVQPGATESGVKPNPDVLAPTPVRPVSGNLNESTQPTSVPITPPEAAPVQTPSVEQTPQAPVKTPAPEVVAPPKAPAVAPSQAASEAVAASPEQQAVVDEAPNVPSPKKNDETVYRGTGGNKATSYTKLGNGTYVSTDKGVAATYGPNVTEHTISPEAKILDLSNPNDAKIWENAHDTAEKNTTNIQAQRAELSNILKQQGYDGVKQNDETVVFDNKHLTPVEASIPKDTPNVKFEQTENPLKGETPPPNPYGVEAIPGLDDETAAQGGTKAQLNEGDKLLSPRAQLSKVGAAGRQILQLFRNKEFNAGRLTTAMENDTPTFHDLSSKDQATAAKVVRGEVTTDNPKINQAAQELRDHFKNVLQAARAAGIDAGDLGEKYIPQMKEAGYFDKASNIKKLIKTLVGRGYSEEQATQTVNRLRNDVRSRPNLAGHLELPREVDDPDQNFNSAKLRAYNEQAASRIAEAQHYGANNEEITKLHGKAAQNGEDVNQIKQITEDYQHPKAVSRGATSKIATGVRGVTNVALLPKAALSHTFQGLQNTASDVGFTKYFKALGNRVFSSDEKDFISDSGIKEIGKGERSVLDKATAPGLKQLRSFHQQVAVLAGKYHADALAAKGDEAGLRKIGVTGDLMKGEDGKISLTRPQQLQAGKVESDKSIFSDSSLETSKVLKGNTGKAIGQFRTAYTAKQGGRIIDLVKQARNGDVAPLLRYLAVGAPVGGVGTLALKNTYKTGNPNPFPSGTSKTSDVLNTAQDSGVESVGFGLPESAINAVRYNYNNNDRVNNAAGAVSPIAGIATEAGQNIDQALRGNDKPLIKQGASYIPLPKVGSMVDKKYAPTTPVTSEEQKYFNAYDPAYSKLMNTVNPFDKSATNQNTEITNTIKGLTSNDHNAQGQSIQKSPAETQAQWTTIAGLPTSAQKAYINFQQSLPNHSPAYDLTGDGTAIDKNGNQSSASKFQIYANYEKDLPGSAERSQLEAMNPWLTKTFAAEQALYNSSSYKSTSVPYNGPLPGGLTLKDLQYPTIPPAINDLMNQATQLSSIPAANRTPEQETQLKNIESNPDLQSAYTALDTYTNNQRVARGAPPLKLAPNASPAVQAAINAYDALPASKSGGNTDTATSGERSAWITAHPALYAQMQAYYASADLANASKGGAENELEGNAPSQGFLGAIKSLGTDDIATTKNANGTTSYSINPALAYSQSGSSGSSNTSASAAAYERDKAAGLSDLGTKYSAKAKVTGLKADTRKYTPPKLLADTAPTGKNGNPFVQAITTTKGVKQRKGGDNLYAANISNTKGVK